MKKIDEDKTILSIFNHIEPFLPHYWEKVVYYIAYNVNLFSMEFFVFKKHGNILRCNTLPGVDQGILTDTFEELNVIISKEREVLQEDKCWTNMTLVISADGTMEVELDYTDLTTDGYKHKIEWQNKYLAVEEEY